MDYFEYYLPIDFHINDVLVNPQFFCKNYPDKTQSVLKELELNCHIDSIDMLKKIYEVINYFGTDFKTNFIEKTSLEFLKILFYVFILTHFPPFSRETARFLL